MDDAANPNPTASWLVRARGHVQGVGYRDSCVRQAKATGIKGWIRNRMDGSVEALLQGSPAQLADMTGWMRDGVSGARVDKLEIEEEQPQFPGLDGFVRLATV